MGLTVEKCLQAWTNSLRQLNAKADFVFYGDSLTYYGDFASVFPNKKVCNLGLRGDTIQGMIDRIDQVLILNPKVVYLMAGINDVGKKPIDEFESQYSLLVNVLVKNLPCVSLLIQSILPVNNKDFKVSCDNNQIKSCNDRIKRIAEVFGLNYLDLYSLYEDEGQLPLMYTKDGIHLIPQAYDRWYHEIC